MMISSIEDAEFSSPAFITFYFKHFEKLAYKSYIKNVFLSFQTMKIRISIYKFIYEFLFIFKKL